LITDLGLPAVVEGLDHDQLLAAMQQDKKAEQGRLRLVLPTCLGHVELVDHLDPQLVRSALRDAP
jgi:3-dehydroquinate synthetase